MKTVVMLILVIVLPVVAIGNTCLLVDYIQNKEWEPGPTSVFPNSICIFPDGRSGFIDSVYPLEFLFGQLYQPYGEPAGCAYMFLGKAVEFGYSGGNVVLCGGGSVYEPCEYLPCSFSSYSIFGGGHSPVDQTGNPEGVVQVIWVPDDCEHGCSQKYVELYVNSPDINGDLVVSLADMGLWSNDYYGTYNYRSDFNFDQIIDLSDLGILSSAMGSLCGQ